MHVISGDGAIYSQCFSGYGLFRTLLPFRFWYVISIMPVKLLFLSAEYIASEDFVQAWKALYFVFTGILASYGKDGSEPAESCTENNNVMILSWLLSSWSAWSIKRLMTFP